MGAGHSAEGDGGAYASDPPARNRRKSHSRRRRHSVDSVASYSSQNHVDRIRAQNFSAASCQDEGDLVSIKTSLFRRSSSNLESNRRPDSVTSNTSSTRSRLREIVERKSSQDEHKSAANTVGDIQYFENPTESLEFDRTRNSLEKKSPDERPKKRKLSKSKEKDKEVLCEAKNKRHEKYQSKLAEYYKLPAQLPQDEFYQHLTRSKAAEELLQKRFSNSDTEFSGSYGRLCKHNKEPEGPNLRRSRSLAVIREETFTDLQIQNHAKSKRSQLIPRARLFDKPCFRDRLPGRAKYQTKEEVLESIYIDSTASCFGDINAHRESDRPEYCESKFEKEDTASRNGSHRSRSVGGSWPNLNEELKTIHVSEDSIGHSRNPSEIDSLDSNYVRKHYNFEAHRKSFKDSSPETERSLASPIQNKELIIKTNDTCSDNENKDRLKAHTPNSIINDSTSRSEQEKIDANKSHSITNLTETYDKLSIRSKQSEIPEDTIKKSIPTIIETNHDDDTQSLASENDEIISSPPDSITSYISISIASSDKSNKLEYLANSLAEKIDEYCDSQFKENGSINSKTVNSEIYNKEGEPIYTKVNKKKTFADIRRDSFLNKNGNLFNEILKKQNNELYVSNTYIECDNYSSRSSCTSKNITTEPFVTTLIENQYYSLPDINISKCLRKSERIDAQLREEDPEEIPCENTYEIAETNFREILSAKGNDNYGQLNKSRLSPNYHNNNYKNNCVYLPEYSEPQIHNFEKIYDDLKSIITVDSSNAEDKDLSFFRSDCHQNEREVNEIEGTIRNNKLITKSESLKVTSYSEYRSELNNKVKSYSNDNINSLNSDKKLKTGVKKHYSLRQRDPSENEQRVPSPETVERSLIKTEEVAIIKSPQLEEIKNQSLISRVQSFKTSADSSIAIVPLSGHQTIVIDPPLTQNSNADHNFLNLMQDPNIITNSKYDPAINREPVIQFVEEPKLENRTDIKKIEGKIDLSHCNLPKDPFITIKLNKVVKATIPKLKKETSDKIACVQHKFEKPPPKLIIKDNGTTATEHFFNSPKKLVNTMSRPQVLQVIDSKALKQNNIINLEKNVENTTNDNMISKQRKSVDIKDDKEVSAITNNIQKIENAMGLREEIKEIKPVGIVKEKLNNAIKTDIEYQEKLNSVKNYWSKLVDKTPEEKDMKSENKEKPEDCNNNTNDKTEERPDENKCVTEISVGSIIKSLESVKIVDTVRKNSQSKLQLWKEDPEKVKSDTEIEETPLEKIVKDIEVNTYDKLSNSSKKSTKDMSRDTPEIEIVELSSDDNNQKTQATLIKAKGYEKVCDEFDHVRYKVMKSELFKNSMIANYRKEAQFDGLLQYLQDYSFQELLVNNNIVIIEPVRTKVEPAPRKGTDTYKISPTLLKKNQNGTGQVDKSKNAIRRHFFYHPIRVNKEIIEEELPNPDTVKKVRNLFEDTLKMRSPMTQDPPLVNENGGLTRRATSYRNLSEETKNNKIGGRKKVIRQLTIDTNYGNKKWDNASLSSGVSSGDLSSNNEFDTDGLSTYSQKHLKDNAYSSSDEYLCESMSQDFCCESQYVSPDILKKIRECGTSVTYYGGKVLNSKTTVSPMTKAIMEEIKSLQKNCSRDCYSCQTKCRGDKCSCLVADKHQQMFSDKQNASSVTSNQSLDSSKRTEATFPGFKFKLVKSNSCSSRLELTGTDESKNSRPKYRRQLSKDDPPLLCDEENSVKNKICRLESYSKGMAKTPFENKDNDNKNNAVKTNVEVAKRNSIELKKFDVTIPESVAAAENLKKDTPTHADNEESQDNHKSVNQADRQSVDPHSFEKKFYYVNDNLDQAKTTTGKFGEMVFEEFEVLESCYDSLNSNKSLK